MAICTICGNDDFMGIDEDSMYCNDCGQIYISTPLQLASKIYKELTRYEADLKECLRIAECYAKPLVYHKTGIELHTTWQKDKIYKMVNILPRLRKNDIIDNSDLNMFIEDLTMMVYRVNNGVGYTTMDLIKDIKKEVL